MTNSPPGFTEPVTRWESFPAFFEATYDRLAASMSVSGEDGHDALQEAYVQAARKWRRISRYDCPEAWVRRVAINRLLNRKRSRRREAAAVERLGAASPLSTRAHEGTGIDFQRALASLTEQQRVVVALHILEELPLTEVATEMGISAGTARSHLHEARKRLARSMEIKHA